MSAFKHKLEVDGFNCEIANSKKDIEDATLLIIPGVGHFASAMRHLHRDDLVTSIQEKVLIQKTPIVGVCLGMQLLTEFSEEGSCGGLSLIQGRTIHLCRERDSSEIVSNTRWAKLEENSCVTNRLNIGVEGQYYFCHSYRVECHQEFVVAYSSGRGEVFPAIIRKENVIGIQFHPEKSHRHGMALLTGILKELENLNGTL